jgi:hypothetical protein
MEGSADEMPIPYGITWRGRVALVVANVILFGFAGLAISYLMHSRSIPWVTLVAAGIWVLMVAGFIAGALIDDGGCSPLQFLINRMGVFSARQFVLIERPLEAPPVVSFGYRVGKHRLFYFRLRLDGIDSVEWSSGQATAIAGRDMDDWSVFIWYDPGLIVRRFPRLIRSRGRSVHCIGDPGPKEATAEFGGRFVALLRAEGADFEKLQEGRKHVRRQVVGPN